MTTFHKVKYGGDQEFYYIDKDGLAVRALVCYVLFTMEEWGGLRNETAPGAEVTQLIRDRALCHSGDTDSEEDGFMAEEEPSITIHAIKLVPCPACNGECRCHRFVCCCGWGGVSVVMADEGELIDAAHKAGNHLRKQYEK